jgi:hypothetical protein
MHNLYVCTTENPDAPHHALFQERFSVNVWAGTVDDDVIGPYVTQNPLGVTQYDNFVAVLHIEFAAGLTNFPASRLDRPPLPQISICGESL